MFEFASNVDLDQLAYKPTDLNQRCLWKVKIQLSARRCTAELGSTSVGCFVG